MLRLKKPILPEAGGLEVGMGGAEVGEEDQPTGISCQPVMLRTCGSTLLSLPLPPGQDKLS